MAQETIRVKKYAKLNPDQYKVLSNNMSAKEIFETLTKNTKLKPAVKSHHWAFSVEQFEYEDNFCCFFKFIDIDGQLVVFYITDDNMLFMVDMDLYEKEKSEILSRLQNQNNAQ